jgi:UPF0271 protein
MEIDLNCDLGEGCPHDSVLMPLITSANVACGFHAGDPTIARATLLAAKRCGVQVGAHPSYPDREHFGRLEMARTEEEIFDDCVYQIGALAGLGRTAGVELGYVKPHGALYNMACRDDSIARPIVAATEVFGLMLMGLPGSSLEARSAGRCRFVPEGFADRRYLPDGSLVPRSRPDAFLTTPDEAVTQATWLLQERGVRTLCVHGDNPDAVAFVRALREQLTRQGIGIRAFA